jgi:predicted glycosyltransferase
MPAKQRAKLVKKGGKIPYIQVIEFDNRMEELIAGAKAVVAMGGYNTYCEILSFDKPALIVPRVLPREEQLIRATRAAELGLIEMLLPEEAEDPLRFAEVLKRLPDRPPPSQTGKGEGMRLEGLVHISEIVGDWLDEREQPLPAVAE